MVAHWLVQVLGPADDLAHLPDLVAGASFSIERNSEQFFLKSSQFEALTNPDDVGQAATVILQRLSSVLQLYVALEGGLRPGNILQADDQGNVRIRQFRATHSLRVISGQALRDLGTRDVNGSTLAANIIGLSYVENQVAEIFSLIDSADLNWHKIYDLIDVLGGIEKIVGMGWAKRRPLSDIRRTANHHRHLGSPRKYPLPATPPSRTAAANEMRRIMWLWITERLAHSVPSPPPGQP